MKCPHCLTDFHENGASRKMLRDDITEVVGRSVGTSDVNWAYQSTQCSKCLDVTIEIAPFTQVGMRRGEWRRVLSSRSESRPRSPRVPQGIAADYVEACNVLPQSAKASAALSRRCLQSILHAAGYRGRDLNAEIDLLLNEIDTKKAIPLRLRETIDAIRQFGNFSAHPIDDKTTLQIIEVEPEEAEWSLEILEGCFEHLYVGPSVARAKRAALDAKLAAAGKPRSN
jgi:hypothetical protein